MPSFALSALASLTWSASATVDGDAVKAALQQVADQLRDKYSMGLSASFHSTETRVSVSSGYTDAGLGMGSPARKALPDDHYVWGSTTKMFTAAAVLQLVDEGRVALTDPIATHVDPSFSHFSGGTSLSDIFGSAVDAVQVQHLLHMTSGIGDYDGEDYARDQFQQRSKDFSPVEIITKYVNRTFQHAPGTRQGYCSTNYILLGFVLATHHQKAGDSWSWQDYNQFSVLPAALSKAFKDTEFVTSGTCQEHTPVHGFMESYSTASLPPQDVWNVSCVGGWTAGNYLGSTADVARFTYELYNKKQPGIVSAASQGLMTNFSAPGSGSRRRKFKFYGMGTFSLDWSAGDAEGYGHVGDTYGYQSQTTYFPGRDFVLSVATNVETNSQAQPGDFTCLAYHAVIAALDGTPLPSCSFDVPYRFIGSCKCSESPAVV